MEASDLHKIKYQVSQEKTADCLIYLCGVRFSIVKMLNIAHIHHFSEMLKIYKCDLYEFPYSVIAIQNALIM